MIWVFVAILAVVSSAILYSVRFTTKLRLIGLDLVQFYYIAIAAPLAFLSIINLGLEIINRQEIVNLPLSTNLLFSGYLLTTCMAVIGTAIHSTSTTVAKDFPKNHNCQAQETNEVFHGHLSHYMTYLGGIFTVVFLAFLEVNHPDFNTILNPDISMVFGAILGLASIIGIIWSTYIFVHLIASFLATSILLYIYLNYIQIKEYYPLFLFSLTAESVVFGGLLITFVIFKSSNKLTRQFIKFFFPSGHPYHS